LSGIVGIVGLDGAPVDPALLQRLTDSLAFRGPDAQRAWAHGPVGFGNALLQIAPEPESQPASLDGRFWITADARVDAREDLVATLEAAGRACSRNSPDPELLLHAYAAWGENCAEHLLGDFAFAIWDEPRKRLFCARDHFGVKPFYYARVGRSFIFSNTLECIRLHPAVSHALNDLAIADFLLFDFNQDLATTSFADIQRLPPAHTLTLEGGTVRTSRYWQLPTPEPNLDRSPEVVGRFRELLDAAVADRLRANSAGVQMSGGLDSPIVAASAKRVFTRRGIENGLRAYTEVFDSLIPHEERYYAGLVAEALKIPIEFLVSDDIRLFGGPDSPPPQTPEPVQAPWPDTNPTQLKQVAVHSRIALTGFGADPALSCRISVHFRDLLRRRQFGRAIANATGYLATEGRLSRLYVRTRWRLFLNRKHERSSFPSWLNDEFAARLTLSDRWAQVERSAETNAAAVRLVAYQNFGAPFWPQLFEWHDTASTRAPVEVYHPFFDLRLLNFLLALPALPWCSDKQLLRESARGVLPDAVRLRRKSPLLADPLVALLGRQDSAWVDEFELTAALGKYVAHDRVLPVCSENDPWTAWINLRPHTLNFWLRSQAASGIDYEPEEMR
jgi:asparagine synthase (glutamine-hydrolysing)